MKRGLFSEKEIQLIHSIEQEFELFQYRTLSKSRKKIFEACCEIRFYSCIYEYFLYAEEIADDHIEACLKYGNTISKLYYLYLKYEYLRCDRWDDIEELLDVFVSGQKHCDSAEALPSETEREK